MPQIGCGFFAYSWKLPAYSGAFLLTVDNFSFFTYSWSFFAYSFSFFTYNWSFFACSGKVRLIRAFRDCKQRSLSVSKKSPTVSKKASPAPNTIPRHSYCVSSFVCRGRYLLDREMRVAQAPSHYAWWGGQGGGDTNCRAAEAPPPSPRKTPSQLKGSALRGLAAILFISRDACSDSIAKLFLRMFSWGIAQLSRDTLQNGVSQRCACVKPSTMGGHRTILGER